MKIIYREGNLLESKEKNILHGCNAQGVMGSGVAKAVREKYPSAYSTYLVGLLQLGIVTYAVQDDGVTVFNCITQEFYGRQAGRVYVSYSAIEDCLQRVDWWAQSQTPLVNIAMPKIGAGLGGGDWNKISAIIEKESKHFQPIVYTL